METLQYDLIVIGGGSGGLALSKSAADLGAKVALLDFVKPSSQGTSWGLGGTCVNVGCIPKKLMHQAAQQAENINDSFFYGWDIVDAGMPNDQVNYFPKEKRNKYFNWNNLVRNIQNNIKGSNFSYRVELRNKKVEYINGLGKLVNKNTVEIKNAKGDISVITSKYIVLSTGGRPYIPKNIPGAIEYAISSDDIFSLKEAPNKTLIIGGGYISLETAGFLNTIGYDISIMVRSKILNNDLFDNEIVDMIEKHMTKTIKFIQPAIVELIEPLENGKKKVIYKNLSTCEENWDIYDTVMFASGRKPDIDGLNLEEIGVKYDKITYKIEVNSEDQTSVSNIYCIGDISSHGIELTPTAISAGKLLANRLFGSSKKILDYKCIPTVLFTPIEYSCVGHTEISASNEYGSENIIIYKKTFNVLEWKFSQREEKGFVKLVCLKNEEERVIGIHYFGPNAGEVIQGFVFAVKKRATKEDFDDIIGIHPTNAESFVYLQKGVYYDTTCCG